MSNLDFIILHTGAADPGVQAPVDPDRALWVDSGWGCYLLEEIGEGNAYPNSPSGTWDYPALGEGEAGVGRASDSLGSNWGFSVAPQGWPDHLCPQKGYCYTVLALEHTGQGS